MEIQHRCKQIYLHRKQFFEEKKRAEVKVDHLDRFMRKLDEDSYILTIPGKFPEAYQKTIGEL